MRQDLLDAAISMTLAAVAVMGVAAPVAISMLSAGLVIMVLRMALKSVDRDRRGLRHVRRPERTALVLFLVFLVGLLIAVAFFSPHHAPLIGITLVTSLVMAEGVYSAVRRRVFRELGGRFDRLAAIVITSVILALYMLGLREIVAITGLNT